MHGKRWLGLWVLLGLLAVGGAWTLGWFSSALPEGPLRDPENPPFTDAFGGYAEPGATHSFGWTVLTNSGVQPAVLDSVTLKETTGLELIGAYTVPGSQTFHINRDYTFPPRGYENVGLIPAPGSIVPPYDGSERTEIFLILALHVPEARGAYSFSGILVDYHVGGQPYRMTFPYSLRLCTPPSAYTYCGTPIGSPPVEA